MAKLSTDPKEKLSMTPMIDVVFLLLIFFIATISPRDLLSAPGVARPQPGTTPSSVQLFKIHVEADGYRIGSSHFRGELGAERLREHLRKVAGFDPDLHVTIICREASRHALLVQLLDACYGAGLTKLALMTG